MKNRQAEILALLDVQDGEKVLEIGPGPGQLIRLMVRGDKAETVLGIDPSELMLAAAARRNRAAVRLGKVVLSQGTAEQTGLPRGSVDRAVAVNNVALWPDLDAGVGELRRVVVPGGTVLLSWHGGTAPHRTARRLRLPQDKLALVSQALRREFTTVRMEQLTSADVFIAA